MVRKMEMVGLSIQTGEGDHFETKWVFE